MKNENLKRCIYCLCYEPDAAFNKKEHVMPQAFGKFEQNFTLQVVCDQCNQLFGNELEIYLARGTLEGIRRSTFKVSSTKSTPPKDIPLKIKGNSPGRGARQLRHSG